LSYQLLHKQGGVNRGHQYRQCTWPVFFLQPPGLQVPGYYLLNTISRRSLFALGIIPQFSKKYPLKVGSNVQKELYKLLIINRFFKNILICDRNVEKGLFSGVNP
jgi:hypothetical protein